MWIEIKIITLRTTTDNYNIENLYKKYINITKKKCVCFYTLSSVLYKRQNFIFYLGISSDIPFQLAKVSLF